MHAPSFVQKFPRVLGIDLSGVVLRTGPGLTSEQAELFKPGTSVMGLVPVEVSLKSGQGSLATHAIVRVENLAAISHALGDNLSLQDAAGLPLVATTALSLVRKVRTGDKVLVCGGSTSVGLVLLQMLKAEGAALIVATASGAKKETVKSLGADEVIDCKSCSLAVSTGKKHD